MNKSFRLISVVLTIIVGVVCGLGLLKTMPAVEGAFGVVSTPADESRQVKDLDQQSQMIDAYGRLPMSFEANQGQADPEVRFLSRGHGYQVYLTGDEAVLALQSVKPAREAAGDSGGNSEARERGGRRGSQQIQTNLLRFKVQGSGETSVRGLRPLPGKSNYIFGNDPSEWHTEIPNYARVEYEDVYPGINLAFYGTQRALEYDFVVRPGADPGQITMSVEGAERIDLVDSGDLILHVGGEKVYHRSPVTYQEIDGAKRRVGTRYVLRGGNRIGFEVDSYDARRALIIDPVIDYSTFLGGIGSDEGFSIAVDSAGNAYVSGTTYSNNFNTFAPLQTINRGGKFDAFVTKINAAGTGLVYSTYFGGSGEDAAESIAVDAAGNAYIAGITNSPDLTLRNPLQSTSSAPADDVFLTKFNASGTDLIFSTYLGGSNNDQAYGLALDSSGNAYITGQTASSNFPTKIALQGVYQGNTDAFVSKIKFDGSELIFSTFLGGTGLDEGYGIAVDPGGSIYVTGGTGSTDFNTFNPLQAGNNGSTDVFVTKINPTGTGLVYSTYLGGGATDVGYGIAVDANLNAYVTGNTFSTDFPTFNPLQAVNDGNSDAFVTRINLSGSGLIYSTYLGGSGGDFARGIAVDSGSNAYVVGRTISTDFNTVNALQPTLRGDFDAFVSKINFTGAQLVYSTYLGGASDDLGFGIAVDNAGNAYVVGDTRSTDFNTKSPLQAANRGGLDAFVSKISTAGTALVYSTYLGGAGEDLGLSLALDTAGNAYITGFTSSNDFVTSNPLQSTSHGGLEVFITKIFSDASAFAFNTYFGGNGSDTANGIAVDGSGNCYITGATTSTNFPTQNPIQPTNNGGLDAFVAKFNSAGSNLIYSTYLGGTFGDQGRAIAVDLAGNAFLTGTTFSVNFPTQSAYQANNQGEGDAFVARLNAGGTALVYSTYLGGTGSEEAAGIRVDVNGNAYVVGNTASTNFDTANPLQPNIGGQQDVFVTKFNPTGSSLLFSTYLGGQRADVGNAIAIDATGNVYITGSTNSTNFPIQSPFQPGYAGGDLDGFVSKINSSGTALVYSTYLGGSFAESGNGITVDSNGNCFVTGVTSSANFPLKNSLQPDNRGGNEAFITQFNAAGSGLVFSTYLGGSREDGGYGIALDQTGTAYVCGATSSPDFNIQFPLLGYGGGTDVFVAKLVSEPTLALTPGTLELQAGSTGNLTVMINVPQQTSVTITLSSSNPGIASVPASVTIPNGFNSAGVPVTAVAIGGPVTITATSPESLGGATATATVNVITVNRVVQAQSANVAAGGLLTVPIDLVSQGNENRLTFSVAIDSMLLLNPQFILGADASGAALTTNTSQAGQGRYGITIALPGGQTFTAGTRQVLVMTAVVLSGINNTTTNINFSDNPTLRRTLGAAGQDLVTNYVPGVVTIASGYEGDVAPRPNGSNGTVTIADWVQTGRFAAGFDTAAIGSEFQRADSAPRSSLGNGAITVSDWVQTGRYAAGLDPIVPSGGPDGSAALISLTQSYDLTSEASQARVVRVISATAQRGQSVKIDLEVDAQGNENAFGFSLNFDSTQVGFLNAVLGTDAGTGTINVNNAQAGQGRIGIALAFPTGQALAAGSKRIVSVNFIVNANSTGESFPITFGDQPVVREVVDANADVLTVNWTDGAIGIPRALASVSAASFLGDALAPDSIVAAFGTGMATEVQIADTLPLPTELAGTTVRVVDSLGAGRSAQLFFVAPMQINYLMPAGTAPGVATVTITSGDGTISQGTVTIAAVAPGAFSANANGQGVAAATVLRVKQDGSQSFEPVSMYDPIQEQFFSIPIDLGPESEQVYLIVFGTGIRGLGSLQAVSVKIGDVDAPVLFMGPQADFVGLDQGNILIPRSLIGRGEVDVAITVEGKPANLVKLNIK